MKKKLEEMVLLALDTWGHLIPGNKLVMEEWKMSEVKVLYISDQVNQCNSLVFQYLLILVASM